jgi:hypothetical protein
MTGFIDTSVTITLNYNHLFQLTPITAAARRKAWTVLAWIVGSNPTLSMDFCLCLFCLKSSGLATCWSPFQGVLPSVLRSWLVCGAQFESRPRYRISCLRFYTGFLLQVSVGMVLRARHDRFLPNPFHFIIHLSMLYCVATDRLTWNSPHIALTHIHIS